MSSPSERPHEQKGTGWQAACTSVALNAALMTMQIAVGLLAHSDGLLADGVHTLADLAADGMVLAVLHIGAIARARHHNPRYDGAEAVASLFIGALLLATGGEMLWQGVGATAGVTDVPSVHAGALVVAIFVILAKEGLFRYMRAAAQRSRSAILMASAVHARVDAVSALVATIGIIGSMAGFAMLDRVAAAVIGVMILRMGWNACRDAVKGWAVRAPGKAAGR